MTTLLAFDTATERMTIALAREARVWAHEAAGGANASTALLPAILSLIKEAGLAIADLDAIAFGRGPGAFTGLRTACSVAQGLAWGAGKPVLPIDSLLAVAEDARSGALCDGTSDGAPTFDVWSVVDARMDQIYAAEYSFAAGTWVERHAPFLTDAAALTLRWQASPPGHAAGDALQAFADRLDTAGARRWPDARARPSSLIALARQAWMRGDAVDAALALPLYVRDKVAETTLERASARAVRDAASEARP